jgi:hypothetical protein
MSWLGCARSLRLRDRLVGIQEVGASKPRPYHLPSIIYAAFDDADFWTIVGTSSGFG